MITTSILVVFASGCGTLGVLEEKTKTPGPSHNNNLTTPASYIKPNAKINLSGSWVFYGGCIAKKGFIDLKKKGRNHIKGTVYLLNNSVGYHAGEEVEISASYDKNSNYLTLVSEQPKRREVTKLHVKALITNNQLTIEGENIDEPNKRCKRFIAAKYPKSDKRQEPKLNFSAPLNNRPSLIPNIFSSRLTLADCTEFYDLLNSSSLTARHLNGIILNEKRFIEYFGTGYENWTMDDVKGYQALSGGCYKMLYQNPELMKKYRQSAQKAQSLAMLTVGKYQGNRSFFNKTINARWASLFYPLATYRAAKHLKNTIPGFLKSSPPTQETISELEKLKKQSRSYSFPLSELSNTALSELSHQINNIYQEKQALFHTNEKERLYAILKNDLLKFNASIYPKTLIGIKEAKNKINKLTLKNRYYNQDSNTQHLVKERKALLLNEHSKAIVKNQISKLSGYGSSYLELKKYSIHRNKVRAEVIPELIHKDHKKQLNDALELEWKSLLASFNKNNERYVFDSNNINSQMEQLSYDSQIIFNTPIKTIRNNYKQYEKDLADFLNDNANTLIYSCDTYAAHPQDKRKPYYITGQTDNRLSDNIDTALDACLSDLESIPNNIRFSFQLGRILFLSQVYDEARTYLETAAKENYAPAMYYLALMQKENVGGFNGGIDKAIGTFDQSADSGFRPAIDFVQNYRYNLKKMQANEERIFKAQYKFPAIIKSLISGEPSNIEYSVEMLYVAGLMKDMSDFCPNLISVSEAKNIQKKISVNNAKGYNQYIERSTKALFLREATVFARQRLHPNNDYKDEVEYKTFMDVSTLVNKHTCDGLETLAFVNNAKKLMNSAPPYNLASSRYWNACINNARNIRAPKEDFCGCFLNNVRGGDAKGTGGFMVNVTIKNKYLNREMANKLLTNFWPTASKLIDKFAPVKACTRSRR